MQLTMWLCLFGLLKVVASGGHHGDAVMVLERFSMELVWLLEVMMLRNRVVLVVVVVVEIVDDLQGLIVTVF